MSLLLPVAAVLLVTAQLPLSTSLQLPTGETVELAADFVLYEPEHQVLTAHGHAQVRKGPLVMRADEVVYDRVHLTVVARGNIMMISGQMAAVADEVSVDLQTFEANVKNGLFMQKRNVSTEQLLAATTPQQLRDLGETPTMMSGRHIRRTGPNTFEVEGLALAPCHCTTGPPSWHVEASGGNVQMGDHATLVWPVVYVYSVPVLALPWMYMPLSNRRSGLLVPKPTQTGLNGFSLEQPIYFTLGRSYDLTLTPAYYFGAPMGDFTRVIDGQTVVRKEPAHVGIRGPRLLTEFRYAPSVGTEGRATLGLLYDLQPVRNPITADFYLDGDNNVLPNPRGLRAEASLLHHQDLGHGFYDRIDAFAVSDGFYTRDITADIVARENQYLRSSGVLFHRADDDWEGIEVGLRQDIRWGYNLLGSTTPPAGAVLATPLLPAPRTFQKLPALSWELPERPLGGSRVAGGLRVEFTRLSPLTSLFGDEGYDGRFEPDGLMLATTPAGAQRVPDPAQGNGILDGLDREARDRIDLRPRLSTSYALGSFARLTPSVGLRQDVYLGEVTGRTGERGYPLLDLRADSELSRTFTLKDLTLHHTIEPSVQLRYVPVVWGDLLSPAGSPGSPGQVYDEIDAALPATAPGMARRFLHGVVELTQTLSSRRGSTRTELLRLSVGQGFDLSRYAPTLGQGNNSDGAPVLRDTFGRLTLHLGALSGGGVLRYDSTAQEIAQLSADLRVDVPKGSLYARYDDLEGVGSDRLRRGLDALVGPEAQSLQRAQFLTVGTTANLLFGLGVRYEAILQPQARNDSPLSQQVLGVAYGPACNCWRIEGFARLARGQTHPDFGVNLTVTGLGTFGSGG